MRVAKAINYLLSSAHWPAFTRFLADGRISLTNNAAERASAAWRLTEDMDLCGIEHGIDCAAFMYSLIVTPRCTTSTHKPDYPAQRHPACRICCHGTGHQHSNPARPDHSLRQVLAVRGPGRHR